MEFPRIKKGLPVDGIFLSFFYVHLLLSGKLDDMFDSRAVNTKWAVMESEKQNKTNTHRIINKYILARFFTIFYV